MNLFSKSKKQKIAFMSMERLIEETSKNTLPTILDTLKRTGGVYEEIDAKTIIMAINYELARYSLYKGNEKKDVDEVLTDLYSDLSYVLKIESENKPKYDEFVNNVVKISKEIFDVKKIGAPAERFVYRLMLEQLKIREDNIPKEIVPELVFYANSWVNNMNNINDVYSIDTSDDGNKSETIDFRF